MKLKYSFILLCFISSLMACKKSSTYTTIYFYTTSAASDGPYTLYVDDFRVGQLPTLSQAPSFSNDSLKASLPQRNLSSKRHTYRLLDKKYASISEGWFHIAENRSKGGGKRGSSGFNVQGTEAFMFAGK